jgi:hypothetical protein
VLVWGVGIVGIGCWYGVLVGGVGIRCWHIVLVYGVCNPN